MKRASLQNLLHLKAATTSSFSAGECSPCMLPSAGFQALFVSPDELQHRHSWQCGSGGKAHTAEALTVHGLGVLESG
eukprot:CAMPEP_0168451994 /NCGR_PEP_ID=MMETSP0228-20121227/48919_1 /TAXON_ID=133427 /ORGANISM="Protoceratium reticulatum, Strain CCCM 535 (=CCMP 1889)" /LENGTH=76 /DNA_ID=CAMNT_0008466621 /DNA_START=183 /DNA_END=410 /DNA_ORIENTATION=-